MLLLFQDEPAAGGAEDVESSLCSEQRLRRGTTSCYKVQTFFLKPLFPPSGRLLRHLLALLPPPPLRPPPPPRLLPPPPRDGPLLPLSLSRLLLRRRRGIKGGARKDGQGGGQGKVQVGE